MRHTLASAIHAASHAGTTPKRLQIDPARIIANTGAIALNGVVLMLLMVPVALPPAAPPLERDPQMIFLPRPVEPPRPVRLPVVQSPTPARPAPATPQPRITPPQVETPVVDSQPQDIALPPIKPVLPDIAQVDPPVQAAASAQLQTQASPAPPYPPEAVRNGLTGTVELEILVGVDGTPQDARIVRSSGHRVLDQAARKVVLTRWRFVPAVRDGQPVQAVGRVPIVFRLDR